MKINIAIVTCILALAQLRGVVGSTKPQAYYLPPAGQGVNDHVVNTPSLRGVNFVPGAQQQQQLGGGIAVMNGQHVAFPGAPIDPTAAFSNVPTGFMSQISTGATPALGSPAPSSSPGTGVYSVNPGAFSTVGGLYGNLPAHVGLASLLSSGTTR